MKLLWNGIVKNEAAILDRCLESLLPHIDGAVLVDTGSTDGTPELLRKRFAKALLPIEIHFTPFINFSQARNEALKRARESTLEWDYLLLADADMELKVIRPNWINGADGESYDLKQTAGAVGYYNRRLLSCRSTGWYVGVTHEYLNVASAGSLDGAEFVDHADGANRKEKFSRDIALLKKALKTEINPGLIQRYHFYLAQSYFDSQEWARAAEHYKIRTTLGGFDEEVWNAQLHYAHCLSNLGDQPGFIWEMLRAYQLRPHRMESLYDLAKYFRERGENQVSLLFSEPGLSVRQPDDLLFVNNYVYHTGLKEEFSICAYYDPARRPEGAKLCNSLSLQGNEQARGNLYWYLQPLAKQVPSFRPTRIDLPQVPDGYVATNPSVINRNGQPIVLVRTVNYVITAGGHYAIRGPQGDRNRDYPIATRNYLCSLDDELRIQASHELALPSNWPQAKFDLVRGFEDSRLFEWNEELFTLSTVRELTPEGWCEQVLAPITVAGYGENWRQVTPPIRQHEKNWMPWVKNGRLQLVYRLGILIDDDANVIADHPTGLKTDHISGGSQVIWFDDVSYLALVHEARHLPGQPHNRYYQHRFVIFNSLGHVRRISPPFYFHDRQIEFAAGVALFGDKLMVSYGVRDCEAWLATMDLGEVLSFILQ